MLMVPFDMTCPPNWALFWRSTESRTASTVPGGNTGLPVEAPIVTAARRRTPFEMPVETTVRWSRIIPALEVEVEAALICIW
jgi:hypothetical protein